MTAKRRRFAWASSEGLLWTQFPLPPTADVPGLVQLVGLFAAVVGGCLWAWSSGTPTNVRVGLIAVACAAIGFAWFHFHQLARRRIPSATLWPAALIMLLGVTPVDRLLFALPSPMELRAHELVAEDESGAPAFLSRWDETCIDSLWFRLYSGELLA
jgi:hypothetical protein